MPYNDRTYFQKAHNFMEFIPRPAAEALLVLQCLQPMFKTQDEIELEKLLKKFKEAKKEAPKFGQAQERGETRTGAQSA